MRPEYAIKLKNEKVKSPKARLKAGVFFLGTGFFIRWVMKIQTSLRLPLNRAIPKRFFCICV